MDTYNLIGDIDKRGGFWHTPTLPLLLQMIGYAKLKYNHARAAWCIRNMLRRN